MVATKSQLSAKFPGGPAAPQKLGSLSLLTAGATENAGRPGGSHCGDGRWKQGREEELEPGPSRGDATQRRPTEKTLLMTQRTGRRVWADGAPLLDPART